MKSCLAWLPSAALVLLFAAAAAAQPRAKGFALDRFEPADRGGSWFSVESLDQRIGAGVVFDYAHRPLVLYMRGNDETVAIVEHQLFAHVGGTLVLTDRIRVALSVPIAVFQDGEAARVSTMVFESDQATTLGDVRLGGDFLLLGEYAAPFALSAGLQIHAPTGSRDSYTGNGAMRLFPRVNVAGEKSMFACAAQLGVKFRAWSDDLGFHVGPKDDHFAGSSMGGDLVLGAAAGVKLAEKRVTLGPELSFASVLGDPSAFLRARTTSAEILLGAHLAFGDLRFGAGVGPGLTRGFGTPAIRGVLSIEWQKPYVKAREPAAPVADRDSDGIPDGQDACPFERGVRSNDAKRNGCAKPSDRDSDGVTDATDACPYKAGMRSADPKLNGCPKLSDVDGDGIADEQDACPKQAGVRNDDPKANGCPSPAALDKAIDRDEDGVRDAEDACPDAEGPKLENPKKTGCPLARIEDDRIKLRERVEFATGSATVLVVSYVVLKAVLKILQQDKTIRRLEVQAHTDSRGDAAYNRRISQERAEAVVDWLVERGIDRARLIPRGRGEEEPIDKNDTATGRLNNRRVEFVILGGYRPDEL
jgi:outer membrane protein OmpA-like peptidoglycan-associated protein